MSPRANFTHFWDQRTQNWLKNENFEKMKKTSPDIPLSNRKTLKPKLGNVIETRYVAPSQFYSFWDQRTQNWLKNENFEKMKKTSPDIPLEMPKNLNVLISA